MTPNVTRNLGYGVGLRGVHSPYLLATPPYEWGVDWFEAITEDYLDGRCAELLEYVAAQRPVVLHGVALNIGGAEPLDAEYLRKLGTLADRIRPVWVSDHLCWTGVNGITTHDLLPMLLTRATLAYVSDRVNQVQDYLQRPLVLENPSSYLQWSASTMPEWEFLTELADGTGCGVLCDVNNIHVSAVNHHFNPVAYIEALPADRIAYVHIAGHTDVGTHLLDTHDAPVADAVWSLYALVQQRTGGVSTLLEWDSDIPSFPQLVTELSKARG